MHTNARDGSSFHFFIIKYPRKLLPFISTDAQQTVILCLIEAHLRLSLTKKNHKVHMLK